MKTDIYETVTNSIIEALEKGLEGEFTLPWHGQSTVPKNARTGNFYHGVNVPLLWIDQIANNYDTTVYATYKQWSELGAQVKKGAKGRKIVFWKSIEIEPEGDNEDREIRMFAKHSTVFNAAQVEGYTQPEDDFVPSDIQAIDTADQLIANSGADIRHDGGGAYYNVVADFINLPQPEKFRETQTSSATENYYSTAFHELVHWTGAKGRLDREQLNKFAKADYAYEELIAELGAAMLCSTTGVTSSTRQDHAQYIENWLKALKNDKKFIFSASSQAQKAADYLFSFSAD